jgi:hypothetical protein
MERSRKGSGVPLVMHSSQHGQGFALQPIIPFGAVHPSATLPDFITPEFGTPVDRRGGLRTEVNGGAADVETGDGWLGVVRIQRVFERRESEV